MPAGVVFADDLTRPDALVLQNLEADIDDYLLGKTASEQQAHDDDGGSDQSSGERPSGMLSSPPRSKLRRAQTADSLWWLTGAQSRDDATLAVLNDLNDPSNAHFQPTVFNSIDIDKFNLHPTIEKCLFRPYLRAARSLVRVETDVVMLNHLLLYLSTSVPSAALLFWKFTWAHGLLHLAMQFSYMGPYTLMMHQHIHMRGILSRRLAFLDKLFPYITDPLMGHTWNSYFYHHVKHHHVEGNGPDDLSSTLRYQRDDILHFLHYVGRFYFFVWLELPLYFFRKGRWPLAAKAAFWELSSYLMVYLLFGMNPRATLCVFILPLALLRVGLMVGNWGQHAFVDFDEPDSDYRSSITLIDVAVSILPLQFFRPARPCPLP